MILNIIHSQLLCQTEQKPNITDDQEMIKTLSLCTCIYISLVASFIQNDTPLYPYYDYYLSRDLSICRH